MKFNKPLTAATVIAGLVVGGAGVAAAGDEGPRGDNDVDQEEVNTGLQVQLEDGDVEGDDNEENEDGRRGRRGQRRAARLATISEVLGIEAEDLRAELQDGATIADVAVANDVDVDDVVDALIANVEERLAEKVEEGDLTEDEAAEKLESKTERISDKVNGIDDDAEAEEVNI